MKALALAAATVVLLLAPALAEPNAASNGVVMMIHGAVEPRADLAPLVMPESAYPFPPPIPEAVLATNDDGRIHLQVIPFDLAAKPVVLRNPRLVVSSAEGRSLTLAPNTDPATRRECAEETGIVTPTGDYSGPLAACLPFTFDARTFQGMPVVTLALRFTAPDGGAGVEVYNVAAHGLIHQQQQSGQPFTTTADAALSAPTPFVIEALVNTSPT